MNIGIAANSAWNIVNFRLGLVKALRTAGHNIVIFAPKGQGENVLKKLGCSLVETPMENKGTSLINELSLLVNYYREFKHHNLDLVLLFTVKPNIYGTLASRFLSIHSIPNVTGLGTVFLHKTLATSFVKRLYAFTFRFPHLIFFQNKDDLALFRQKCLIKHKRVALLPGSGINISQFPYMPFQRNRIFTFLMISRLLYDKGIIEFYEAARKVKQTHPQCKIAIVGQVETEANLGVDIHTIQQWVDEGVLEYWGVTNKIQEKITQADCIVLPSYREGTPRALLEGACMGKPLIATDVAGCREVVKDSFNGYLCQEKDSESLAKAMEMMLSRDNQQLRKMAENGRKLIEENFKEEIVIAQYLKVIQAIEKEIS